MQFCYTFTVSITLNTLEYRTCRNKCSINSLVKFWPGSKNRINAYMRFMQLAVITEFVHKSTSEFMLELVSP